MQDTNSHDIMLLLPPASSGIIPEEPDLAANIDDEMERLLALVLPRPRSLSLSRWPHASLSKGSLGGSAGSVEDVEDDACDVDAVGKQRRGGWGAGARAPEGQAHEGGAGGGRDASRAHARCPRAYRAEEPSRSTTCTPLTSAAAAVDLCSGPRPPRSTTGSSLTSGPRRSILPGPRRSILPDLAVVSCRPSPSILPTLASPSVRPRNSLEKTCLSQFHPTAPPRLGGRKELGSRNESPFTWAEGFLQRRASSPAGRAPPHWLAPCVGRRA